MMFNNVSATYTSFSVFCLVCVCVCVCVWVGGGYKKIIEDRIQAMLQITLSLSTLPSVL
jgi:hypothetical protein